MATNGAEKISVIVPVYNEEACIEATLDELGTTLQRDFPDRHEIIVINDGSTDRTAELLLELAARMPTLRLLALTPNAGQSAAFGAGFHAASHPVIVTIDADGQNDPADIQTVVASLQGFDVCCGYRKKRRDTWSKRIGSRFGNKARNLLLGESIRDTGCSLKAFRAAVVRDLPMSFAGMHRFLPALCVMKGATICEVGVNHRPRTAGYSKYTNWGRLKMTIGDVFAVRWMQRRYRKHQIKTLTCKEV